MPLWKHEPMNTKAEDVTEQQPPAGAVVVGVDGSEHDVVVLTAAVAEAVRRGAPLHIRHCHEALDPYLSFTTAGILLHEGDEPSDDVLEAAEQTVATLAPELSVTVDRPAGRPENLLVKASEDAAAVVVGTGRKSRIEELLLGAVALNVAAHAHCPVLVVPPGADPDGKGEVAVGVDGSDHSRAALLEAIDVARTRKAPLVVITTWLHEVADGYIVTEPGTPEWQQVEARIRALQQRLVDDYDTSGVDVELRPVHGGIRSALAEESKNAAVLVVGNRGRGGFLGKTLGSVTMDLLKRASCPVLVVHTRH